VLACWTKHPVCACSSPAQHAHICCFALRLAALETLLEEGELVNEEGGYPLLPGAFRLVFAQLAASVNRLADAVNPGNHKQGVTSGHPLQLPGSSWAACKEELKAAVTAAVQQHWQRVVAAEEVQGGMGNMHEVSWCTGCMEDSQAPTTSPVLSALSHNTTRYTSSMLSTAPHKADMLLECHL
jgi:hypothetical protein